MRDTPNVDQSVAHEFTVIGDGEPDDRAIAALAKLLLAEPNVPTIKKSPAAVQAKTGQGKLRYAPYHINDETGNGGHDADRPDTPAVYTT